MKKLKILLYFLLAVGVYGLLDAVRASRPVSAFLVAAGIVLVSAGGLFLLYRKAAKTDAGTAAQPGPPPDARRGTSYTPAISDDKYKVISVVGVTFDNDDGTSRQQLLKKLYFKDPPFDGFVQITFEEYFFHGETAFAVLADGAMIGNVGRRDIPFFEEYLYSLYVEDFEVTVGGMDEGKENIRYGCKIRISYGL